MSEKHAASKVSATQPAEPTVVEKPRWRQNVESIGLALLIALAVRSSVVQAFWVPSGSMLPTIQIGDHIFVNKLAYAVRVPLIGTEIVKVGDLHRDDVVVFVSPVDPSTDLIKRVVAVPGDTPLATLTGIIADEMAIGTVNHKTTAVRIIPVPGKKVGETVEWGGLLGTAIVQAPGRFGCELLHRRGGRIPAPLVSFRN